MRSSVIKKTALHRSYPGSDLVLLAELSLYGEFYEYPESLLFPRIHPQQTWITTPVERDRVLFYDTSLKGKVLLPKWEYLFGYLRAIRHAPLSSFARSQCLPTVLRWVIKPDHFRAMGKDALLAARQLFIRAFFKPKGETPQAI